MYKYCFGVDLGGTTVKIGLFDMTGNILTKWEIPTRKEDKGSNIIPDIAHALNDEIADRGLDKQEICGIGFGVPGAVVNENTVPRCVNLGWGRTACADELSALTGLRVVAGNDANAAALGEQWLGGGSGYRDVVMITLGTGVGGGIVIGGRIHSGTAGAAGEIGHMNVVDPADIIGSCNCGRTGCLEQAASATGLVNVAKVILSKTDEDSVLRQNPEFTAKDIFDAAKAGDALAVAATEKMMDYLGRAAAMVACVVNPEAFVIGGGVSKAGNYLLEGIEKAFKKYCFKDSADTVFKLAELDNDAGMCGAARFIIGKYE